MKTAKEAHELAEKKLSIDKVLEIIKVQAESGELSTTFNYLPDDTINSLLGLGYKVNSVQRMSLELIKIEW